MDLRDARFRTGVSEKTLRKWIAEGKLKAEMVSAGNGRRWEVSEAELATLGFPMDGTSDGSGEESSTRGTEPVPCANCEWLRGQAEVQNERVRELHLLLQQAQQLALPVPKDSRSWWRRLLPRSDSHS